MSNQPAQPVLFVSHGAAIFTTSPGDPTHRFLSGLAEVVSDWKPTALLVVSAHFSSAPVALTGAVGLQTIHDHPVQALYGYRYPGHADEQLTHRVHQALLRGGVRAITAPGRGLDHGAWVPLSLLRPRGDLPVMQVSLDDGLSPEHHVALGRGLATLRDEGVLIIGSGGVTHNQAVFRAGFFGGAEPGRAEPFSRDFDAWATQQVVGLRGAARASALAAFRSHPLASKAHPTTEHFLPLLVACGAAGDDPGLKLFEGFQHSLSTSAFQFGAAHPGSLAGA